MITLLLASLVTFSHATTEKVLGPVVAVERTYTVDAEKLIEDLKSQGGVGFAFVQVYNDEVLQLSQSNSNLQNVCKLSTVNSVEVTLCARVNGYSVSVSAPGGAGLVAELAASAVRTAVSQTQTLKITVLKVQ